MYDIREVVNHLRSNVVVDSPLVLIGFRSNVMMQYLAHEGTTSHITAALFICNSFTSNDADSYDVSCIETPLLCINYDEASNEPSKVHAFVANSNIIHITTQHGGVSSSCQNDFFQQPPLCITDVADQYFACILDMSTLSKGLPINGYKNIVLPKKINEKKKPVNKLQNEHDAFYPNFMAKQKEKDNTSQRAACIG